MKQIKYIGEYAKNQEELKWGCRSAKINLGDYDNWEEVLQSPILWGSINFSVPDIIVLKKNDKFPKQSKNLTFFDEEEYWTYVRVLNIIRVECVTTSKEVWKDNDFKNRDIQGQWIVGSYKVYHYENCTVWDIFTIGNQYIHAQYHRGQLTVTMNIDLPNREVLYTEYVDLHHVLSTDELKEHTKSILDWSRI